MQEKADRAHDTYRKAVQEHKIQVCSVKEELDKERLNAANLTQNIESLEASVSSLKSHLVQKATALEEAE